MLKKITSLLLALLMVIGLTACSSGTSKSKKTGKTDNGITIKGVKDFQESTGQIKYFTIEGKKFAIPETVGEYANYLEQLGTVTLGSDDKDIHSDTVKAGGLSSLTEYFTVKIGDNDVRFWVSYKNNTKKELTIAECSITQLQFKYDVYAEQDYEKACKSVVFYATSTDGDTVEVPMDGKIGYVKVLKMLGDASQVTDGRITYKDSLGYTNIWDCCNENRTGIFRGVTIKYPSK
ncbi:MAG: hypothetical protein PHH04_00505 [Thomasclavelia sp.]|jgi:hypothetical protein|nr:hypothetical protein [Thomasclavelia sp.]